MFEAALRIRKILLSRTQRISGSSESLISKLGILLGILKFSLPLGQSLLSSLHTIQSLGQDPFEVLKAALRIHKILLSRTQRISGSSESLISKLSIFLRICQLGLDSSESLFRGNNFVTGT